MVKLKGIKPLVVGVMLLLMMPITQVVAATNQAISEQSITRAKQLLDNPKTWEKIPSKIRVCYFSLDNSKSGTTYQYLTDQLKDIPRFTEIAKLIGIDMDIQMVGAATLRISLGSVKLKRKATTDVVFAPYTDERIVAEDFKANVCDGVAMSNMRARQFNPFIGSLDAIGAVPTYRHLTEAIDTLSKPQLAKYMVNKDYEVVGIMPLGAAYFMVNDRKINSIAKAAGKKIAVMDFDKSQATMVQQVGAQPVSVDLSSVGGKFNNGQVDIIGGPALMFKPLELYKGMTDNKGQVKGAIIRFPLMQLTGVFMMHRNRFPDGVGQLAREFSVLQLPKAYNFVNDIERDIPLKYWMDVNENDIPGYIQLMRGARINMTGQGFYDKTMMSLLKKVRCKLDPRNGECTSKDE